MARSKYNAQPTEVDGIKFASKKEAARYGELKLLEKAGEIYDLEVHPAWRLRVNGQLIGRYTADFKYTVYDEFAPGQFKKRRVVEDVKGVKTRDYKLRKKLMLACHGIEVVEV